MLRLILVRPGTSDFDEQGRIKGTLDIPLNQHGCDQAARAASELATTELDAIYCSPCQVAQQTAETLANQQELKVKVIEKFQNIDHGLWHGKLIEDVRQKQPKVYRQFQDHPESCCPPDGEPVADAIERVDEGLKKLLKKHKAGTIAIVAPEPVFSLIRALLSHASDLGDLWKAECQCGSWEAIEVNGKPPAAAAPALTWRGQPAAKR